MSQNNYYVVMVNQKYDGGSYYYDYDYDYDSEKTLVYEMIMLNYDYGYCRNKHHPLFLLP